MRSVRVVVLAGAGRAFCAGHDLNEMRAHIDHDVAARAAFDACTRMMLKLTQTAAAGDRTRAWRRGRCADASWCRCAISRWPPIHAKFGLSGINAGIFCTTPAVGVARNIGRKRAMELLLDGRARSTREPRSIGDSSTASCRPRNSTRAGARAGVGSSRAKSPPRSCARQARVLCADRSVGSTARTTGRRNDGVQHARSPTPREGIDAFPRQARTKLALVTGAMSGCANQGGNR